MQEADFVIVGYAGVDRILHVDAIPPPGVTALVGNRDHRKLYYGGCATNITYALGRLGCSTYPLVRVGEDWKEIGYQEQLMSCGACLEGVHVVEGETTSICHLVEDDGKNHLTMTYPGAMDVRYATRPYPDEVFRRAKYAVLTVSTSVDTRRCLETARRHRTPLVLGMRADFNSFPEKLLWEVLREARIIFTNQVERELIERLYPIGSILDLFDQGRAELIVTTLGGQGSEVFAREEAGGRKSWRVPVTPGDGVVDATGAGDGYMAGFLYGHHKGKSPAVCAQYGSTMASFVIEAQGCTTRLPTLEAMLERNARRPDAGVWA